MPEEPAELWGTCPSTSGRTQWGGAAWQGCLLLHEDGAHVCQVAEIGIEECQTVGDGELCFGKQKPEIEGSTL